MRILLDFLVANPDKGLFDYTFYDCLMRPLKNKDVHIDVLLAHSLYDQLKNDKKYENCSFYPVNLDDFEKNNINRYRVFNFLYSENGLNSEQVVWVKKFLKDVLKDVNIDISISFEMGNCILKEFYPQALHLTFLGGLWKSCAPDFSVVFDPINSVSYSSLIKFKDEINNFQINATQNKKIENLKKIYKKNIIKTKIAKRDLLKHKKKFNKLILLPLQMQGYHFSNEVNFKSQKEYFEYVVNRIPSNIGLVVTGHNANLNEIKEILINNKETKKYENVIVLDELMSGKYSQSSLYVLPYIDGMINVCSSLVLKALLADVKIFSLGKQYNLWCQDFQGLENLEENLNKPIRNKNNILYWYLTHYDFLVRKVISDNWLYNFLMRKLQKPRNINFDYFDEDVNIDDVIKYFKTTKYCNIEINQKNFINILFSITETKGHKVINFLGIKIKYKRKAKNV